MAIYLCDILWKYVHELLTKTIFTVCIKKKIPITEIIGIKKGFGYDLEIKLSFI